MAISPDIESGPFIGNGAQTAFPFSFTAITPTEVAVELDGVAQSSGFTVTLADVGGTVTFGTAPATGVRITLRSSPDYLQDSAFENEGAYNLATVNTINRRQTVRALVTRDQAKRAVKAPGGDGTDMTLPAAAARADKLLGFGAIGDGAAPAVFDISANALETLAGANGDIVLLADNIGSIDSVAANLSGSNTIGTVATNIANVDAVGGAIASVGAVAGDLTAINAVAGNATNINAVTGNAANINAVASNAANVSAVAAISGNVTQVANDHAALVAVANDLANLDAVATNLPAVNAVVAAAVTLGVFPNTAGVGGNVPKGAISLSFTGGSGGANSVNNLATFTGGTLTSNPRILYDVVGGAVTNVRMTFGGLYIGSSTPTMPTAVLANGGSGTITLVGGLYYTPGQTYWAVSADGRTLDSIVNTAGAPASNSAAVPSIYLKPVLDELIVAGGRQNLFPDPFFTQATTGGTFRGTDGVVYISYHANMSVNNAAASATYPDGKYLSYTSNTSTFLSLFLENQGIVAGDVIRIGAILSRASGSTANGQTAGVVYFYTKGSTSLGSQAIFIVSASSPHDTTPRTFLSGDITIPAGCTTLRIDGTNFNYAVQFNIHAMWGHKTSIPAAPVDCMHIPRGRTRLRRTEIESPIANGMILKGVAYDTLSVALIQSTGSSQNLSRSGYAQSQLKASAPASFNAVRVALDWATSIAGVAPLYFFAEVSTSTTASTLHPANGRMVARGWITVNTAAGSAGPAIFVMRDPVSGAVKSVTPADLDDKWCVRVYQTNSDGTMGSPLFLPLANPTFPVDTDFPVAYAPAGGSEGTWGAATNVAGCDFLTLTNPIDTYNASSGQLAVTAFAQADEIATLNMLPKKVHMTVGQVSSVYYDCLSLRRGDRMQLAGTWSGTAVPAGSGLLEERIRFAPTGSGTSTLTLTSGQGVVTLDSRTCAFIASPASNASGTRLGLVIGDSIGINLVSSLNTIAAGQAVTTFKFLGKIGSALNLYQAISAFPLGGWNGATAGGNPNPFYNGTTFSFSTFLADSTIAAQIAASGRSEPDFVIIEGGQVEVGPALSDAAARGAAAGVVATAEAMIQSILAATTNTAVIIHLALAGPVDAGALPSSYAVAYRQRKNWLLLAEAQIAAFSGREASRIHVAATNVANDPVTAYARTLAPRSDLLVAAATTYANYAAMKADPAKAAGAFGVINGVYYVKEGPSGDGFWRSARPEDGFIYRHTDVIHPDGTGSAQAIWGLLKFLN